MKEKSLAEINTDVYPCLGSPGPGEHVIRDAFDEGNPVYRSAKATEWAKRCSRDAFASALNPGKMIKIRGESPGPGHYKYKNMTCGVDAKKFTFRRRTVNLNGKCQNLYAGVSEGLTVPKKAQLTFKL